MSLQFTRITVSSDNSRSLYKSSFSCAANNPITGIPSAPYYQGGSVASSGKYFLQKIVLNPNQVLTDIKSVLYRWRPNFDGIDGTGFNWDAYLQSQNIVLIANERTNQCVDIAPDNKLILGPLASDYGPNTLFIEGASPFYAIPTDTIDVLIDGVLFKISPSIPLGFIDVFLADFDVPPYRKTSGLAYVTGT